MLVQEDVGCCNRLMLKLFVHRLYFFVNEAQSFTWRNHIAGPVQGSLTAFSKSLSCELTGMSIKNTIMSVDRASFAVPLPSSAPLLFARWFPSSVFF